MKRIIDYVESIDPDFREKNVWHAGVKKRSGIHIKEEEKKNGIDCRHYKYWPITSKDIALKIEEILEDEGFLVHKGSFRHSPEAQIADCRDDSYYYYVYVFRAESLNII